MTSRLDSALAKVLLSGDAGVRIDSAAVESAVQQQLIHGGALDTLLLEMGAASEAVLTDALIRAWGTSPVDPLAFEQPDDDAVSALPRRMAVAMGLFPFRRDVDGTLHVACRAPLDTGLIDEVGGLIGLKVTPHVVPEVRLVQGLHAAYDTPIDERFVALLRQLSPDARAANAGPDDDVDAAADLRVQKSADDVVVSWDLVEAMAHLAAQDSRDGIARVAVTFARRFLPFAAVFGVRDNTALGWYRLGPCEGALFESRPFPLPAEGFLPQSLGQSSPAFLRPQHDDGAAAFFGWLGRRRPKSVLLVPIVVARRPVGALYADGGIRQRDPRDVGELVAFAARLGPAFEALLRQRHRQHPSIFPQPAATLPPMPAEDVEPANLLTMSTLPMAAPPTTTTPTTTTTTATPTPTAPGPSQAQKPVAPPAMPAVDDTPRMPAVDDSSPRDGTSPFARNYSVHRSELMTPPPMPPVPPVPPRPADDDGPIVLSGMGAAMLDEHLAARLQNQQASDDAATRAATPALFRVGDGTAPEAWRGALRDTVEKGLQGGTGDDDDEDLNWEDVVYDPAHAAELEVSAPPKVDPSFPALSTSTLMDLYGDGDGDPDGDALADSGDGDPSTQKPAAAADDDDDDDDDDDKSDKSDKSDEDRPRSVAPTRPDTGGRSDGPALATLSHKDLVEYLFVGDDEVVSRAVRELVSRGLAAVPALGERFPGRLRVDPFDRGNNVRSPDRLGPLLEVLWRLGNDGLDAAIPHVDSRYPAHRFSAVLLFSQTPDSRAIDLLRNRLHDAEPRIRDLAAEALMPFLAHTRFESLLLHLRERATPTQRPYPLESRRRAAELLGAFRDVGAVPLLIGLLGQPDMQDTARRALRGVTLQDLGARPRTWEKWWAKAKKRSRLDWLIDALSSEELELRSAAHRELADLAGDDFGYRADADKRTRQRAIDVWQQWWAEEQARAPKPRATQFV